MTIYDILIDWVIEQSSSAQATRAPNGQSNLKNPPYESIYDT